MDKCLRILTSCALLFAFYTSTNAALRVGNSQSSRPLSLVQINASTSHPLALPHIATNFPPGLQPDEYPFFYDVPYANPPMNIKFRNYELIADRDETDVQETISDAVADCIGPGRRTMLIPDGENHWASGEVDLMVLREDSFPDQSNHLTYGIFSDALRGVNNFRLFYPHLDFAFDIYVYDQRDEQYVGRGYLAVD